MKNRNVLIREQMDVKLTPFQTLLKIPVPSQGWIKSIRSGLAMNARQLADRLQVDKSRITRIEKDEIKGALTIKTLEKIAKAMGCQFVYALVPPKSLANIVEQRAKTVSLKRMERINQTMKLENQELTKPEKLKIIQQEKERVQNELPKLLWEEA